MWQQWISGSLGIAAIFALYPYTAAGAGRILLVIICLIFAILGYWGGTIVSKNRRNR